MHGSYRCRRVQRPTPPCRGGGTVPEHSHGGERCALASCQVLRRDTFETHSQLSCNRYFLGLEMPELFSDRPKRVVQRLQCTGLLLGVQLLNELAQSFRGLLVGRNAIVLACDPQVVHAELEAVLVAIDDLLVTDLEGSDGVSAVLVAVLLRKDHVRLRTLGDLLTETKFLFASEHISASPNSTTSPALSIDD